MNAQIVQAASTASTVELLVIALLVTFARQSRELLLLPSTPPCTQILTSCWRRCKLLMVDRASLEDIVPLVPLIRCLVLIVLFVLQLMVRLLLTADPVPQDTPALSATLSHPFVPKASTAQKVNRRSIARVVPTSRESLRVL